MRTIHLRKKIGTGLVFINCIFRYILRINKTFPFPVNFTSRISYGDRIVVVNDGSEVLYKCLGLSGGLYIQACNGIKINSSVHIAPGVKLVSANHDLINKSNHTKKQSINIERDVWIGANATILPGVHLSQGVVVGAGSVVTKSFGPGSVIAGVPARLLKNIEVSKLVKM